MNYGIYLRTTIRACSNIQYFIRSYIIPNTLILESDPFSKHFQLDLSWRMKNLRMHPRKEERKQK